MAKAIGKLSIIRRIFDWIINIPSRIRARRFRNSDEGKLLESGLYRVFVAVPRPVKGNLVNKYLAACAKLKSTDRAQRAFTAALVRVEFHGQNHKNPKFERLFDNFKLQEENFMYGKINKSDFIGSLSVPGINLAQLCKTFENSLQPEFPTLVLIDPASHAMSTKTTPSQVNPHNPLMVPHLAKSTWKSLPSKQPGNGSNPQPPTMS